MSSTSAQLLTAERLLVDAQTLVEGGALLVRSGRVERVLGSPSAVRRALHASGVRAVALEGDLVTPGLVDAHAHLELSALAGRVPGEGGFVPWIRSLMAARGRIGEAALRSGAARGAERLLATGTTCVGDIASLPLGEGAALDGGLRARVYREVLDAWRPEGTASALARVRRALPRRRTRLEGLSPHAPYTTSPALLAGVARVARARRIPLACHWSETPEETRWLAGEEGPFDALIGRSGPGVSALELYAEAGLLGPHTTLVHGNHPARGELAAIARAGSAVVHCPGTHRFFGRAPFPWQSYRRAGVTLALGTDSLASNEDLDLTREMALAREAAPFLSPASVWDMATVGGARALGLAGQVGCLERGAWADLVAWRGEAHTRVGALEELTQGRLRVRDVLLSGRRRRIESRGDLP